MDLRILEDMGLNSVQAATYAALVTDGTSTAPALAEHTGESRSNTYKVLDRLCELGLARKDTEGKIVRYTPQHPGVLEQQLDAQERTLAAKKQRLQSALPELLSAFFAQAEQPSIRFFQGKDGIRRIFTDMLKTGQTVYLLRSPADVDFYDPDFFAEFRRKRAKLGITTYALTPDIPTAIHDPEVDTANRFNRLWLSPNDYTASVEWDIYGDKVALISYGQEAMGIIVESPNIAESFRQIFMLLHSTYSSNSGKAPGNF